MMLLHACKVGMQGSHRRKPRKVYTTIPAFLDPAEKCRHTLPEVSHVVKKFASFIVNIFPTPRNVLVHEQGHVVDEGLRGNAWRGIMHLGEVDEAALLVVIEQLVLVDEPCSRDQTCLAREVETAKSCRVA